MSYEFRQGVHIPAGVTADQAAHELERIRESIGLTPKNVVNESRPTDAPLHPCFEWDDTKAAERYREGQARTIIRAVILVEGENSGPIFYHIQAPEQPARYEHINVILKQPDMYDDALRRLKAELDAAAKSVAELRRHAPKAKAKNIQKLAGVLAKAQEVAARV